MKDHPPTEDEMNWRIYSVHQIVKIGLGSVRCFWARLGMITSLRLNTRLIRMGRKRRRGSFWCGTCKFVEGVVWGLGEVWLY
jgi:hypothetical protein